MADDLKHLYREGVSHALGGFQLLEEGLKTYIGVYHQTVRAVLNGRLHYDYDQSDVQEAPLGRLLTVFAKICSNEELLAEMRSLLKHRDQAAHQAFICLYGPGPGDHKLIEMSDANAKLGTQLSLLLPRLHQEMLKVCEVLRQLGDDKRDGAHAA